MGTGWQLGDEPHGAIQVLLILGFAVVACRGHRPREVDTDHDAPGLGADVCCRKQEESEQATERSPVAPDCIE